MAEILLNKIMLEEKLVELWPDYGCLFDVRSPHFKNRDTRQVAIEEIAIKFLYLDSITGHGEESGYRGQKYKK